MRKSVILFVLLSLLIFPTFARAQSSVTFEKLVIQFWPDFDQPSVLVIYDFVVSSETPLPAQVNIRMPAGAQLFAVARDEAGMLMNVEHDPPVQAGNYSVVSFVVTDRLTYRLEFYIPYVRQEQRRTFIYTWPGDYAVASLRMLLQEPMGAANIVTEPDMAEIIPGADGFTYRALSAQDVKDGAGLTLKVGYDSENGEPFINEKPQPSAPLEPSQPFMSFLPWILGGVGVMLIVGGGVWYWLSGRTGSGNERSRKRHVSRDEEIAVAAVYCSQCGKRAQPNDRFCRACGTKLRQ